MRVGGRDEVKLEFLGLQLRGLNVSRNIAPHLHRPTPTCTEASQHKCIRGAPYLLSTGTCFLHACMPGYTPCIHGHAGPSMIRGPHQRFSSKAKALLVVKNEVSVMIRQVVWTQASRDGKCGISSVNSVISLMRTDCCAAVQHS